MGEFKPVSTVADLMTLDSEEIVRGYSAGLAGDREPTNCTRSYWHGWRNGVMDTGRRNLDAAARQLASDVIRIQTETGKTLTETKLGVQTNGKSN